MLCVGWDNREKARLQYLRIAVDCHLKLTFNGKGTLLVDMPVQGYRASCLNLNKIDRIGIGMDQLREESRCDLLGGDIRKIAKNVGVHK